MTETTDEQQPAGAVEADDARQRGKTVHGEPANAGHRVLAPDDAEVEAYLEVALDAPAPERDAPATARRPPPRPPPGTVAVLDFGSQFAQLIARRVRELNVYSELLPHDTPIAELERRGVRAVILSGGPMSVYDDGAPKPDASIWSGRLPVLGICYGAQLMALELGGDVLPTAKREYGPATVQITRDDGLFDGHRSRAAGVDEPRRLDHPPARGLPRDGADGLDALRRPGRPGPQPVRHPVPPRGRPHPARPGRAAQLRHRHRGHRARPGRPPTSSTPPSPRSASASMRHARRDGLGRQGHLRAVGRRGLGGRGGARPSRRRRPADLHLRRPRADAQEGVGAAPGDLRGQPRHAAGDGRRARAVPGPARRRHGPGAEAADHRRRVHPRVRGGGRQARADRLPDPGDALPGRHRVDDARDEDRPEDQDPPQRRRAAGRPAVRADRAAALPVQGRGAARRPRARPAGGDGPAPAVPRAGARDPDHRRGHRRAAGHAARRRLDRDRRDQGRRPVPQRVAVVRDPHPGPQRRRHGRRAHVRERGRDPRGDQSRTA